MSVKFIGNTGTKTLHAVEFSDGRCKISQIRKEQKKEFATLEDALSYPDRSNPIFHKCGICFPKMEKQQNP